jgi:hypothetical protein
VDDIVAVLVIAIFYMGNLRRARRREHTRGAQSAPICVAQVLHVGRDASLRSSCDNRRGSRRAGGVRPVRGSTSRSSSRADADFSIKWSPPRKAKNTSCEVKRARSRYWLSRMRVRKLRHRSNALNIPAAIGALGYHDALCVRQCWRPTWN